MTVTVVVGAPSSGAGEYAHDHQWIGEPVVDLDRMLLALGADDADDASDIIRRAGYASRSGAIALLLESGENAQIVHTAPTADHVAMYQAAGCEFVLVDPGLDECLARAEGRPDRITAAIRAWYADPPELPEGTTVVSDVEAQNRADRKAPSMSNKIPASRYWGSLPVPTSKAEFFNAVTTPSPVAEGGTVATIRMYGPIDSYGGFWGISAKDMGVALDALPDSVDQIILRINSPGGEVFEGVGILNLLRAHKAKVTAVVDGLAASAASIIAAGADETVMSPGTQMMIHKASSIVWGNANDLRKVATTLEGIDASIIEIYTAKAGAKDWSTLLSDETWMTSAEAVSQGLADRVAVIPDAGEAVTAGEEEPDEVVILVDDEYEDSAAARVVRIVNRHIAPRVPPRASATAQTSLAAPAWAHMRPAEPGITNTQEGAEMALKDIIAARLGISAADVTDEQVVAALDEALAEQTTPAAAAPAGTRIIDEATLAQMQADAAAGREAREQQIAAARAVVVDTAIADGKIPPARRDHYLNLMRLDEEGTSNVLNELATGAFVPVAEVGVSGGIAGASDDEDAIYNQTRGAFTDAATDIKE